MATTGISPSTEAAIEAMQQSSRDQAALTGANATFQGSTAAHEVTNNAVAAATSAAATVGRTT